VNEYTRYQGLSDDWSFELDVFKDEDKNIYIGVLNGHTPSMLNPLIGDLDEAEMQTFPEERLENQDLDKLLQKSKKRMEEIGGNLLSFSEIDANT
jgi:hypothetical protein